MRSSDYSRFENITTEVTPHDCGLTRAGICESLKVTGEPVPEPYLKVIHKYLQ